MPSLRKGPAHDRIAAVLASPDDVNLRWLLGLRWAGYLGLALAVAVASSILRLDLPLGVMTGAVVFGAISNLGWSLARVRRAIGSRRSVVLLLTLDAVVITCVLHSAGGPTNPFVLTYLLLLVVAAVTVGRRTTLALFGLTVLCLGALSVHPRPLRADHEHSLVHPEVETHPEHEALDHDSTRVQHLAQHLHGVSLALIVLGAMVVYSVRWALEGREAELRALRAEQDRNARLLELSTLAAAAAHELGTPLSTIAVVTKELERRLALGDSQGELGDDIRTIREQVERCRRVLADLGNDARAGGEQKSLLRLGELVELVRQSVSDPDRLRVEIEGARESTLCLPRRSLAGVVTALVENGLEATPREPVVLRASAAEGWCLEVIDRGEGPQASAGARLGHEPLSTKPDGMGIGLFLGRAILDRLGGTLELITEQGSTRAVLRLPAASADASVPRYE
ncbi:MAG TPA: ATP-binding protein [Polyangiaceae bacterium]|nr:ATP-binding protein [Polyangiaceae bacterium]